MTKMLAPRRQHFSCNGNFPAHRCSQMFRRAIDSALFSHTTLLLILTGFCAWYLFDAWSAAPTIENLVAVAPLGIAGIVIGGTLLALHAFGGSRDPQEAEPAGGDVILMVFLLIAYVFSMPVLGMTLSTAVYIFLSMRIMKVARWDLLLAYPLALALLSKLTMERLVSLPEPLIMRMVPEIM